MTHGQTEAEASAHSSRPHEHRFGLALIAVFKLVKGMLLLATAIGLLHLVHRDLAEVVESWILLLRMDPNNHYLHAMLQRVANISPGQLEAISAGSFFYSALLLTEGTGLWFERRWAEYLTVIATGSLVPLELYELWLRVDPVRIAVLLLNLLIVAYLVRVLRQGKTRKV